MRVPCLTFAACLFLVPCAVELCRAADDPDIPAAKTPAEALRSFVLAEGAEIELVAAEPLVEDPVAFDWGPDGRLWVVEMRDYPNGLTWNGAGDPLNVPGGRVKVLVDEDGDGTYDRATVFLDDLPFPNGIKVWREGILVTVAPDVIYAEDSDGDGVADKREVLFTGFKEGNQQHRVNGLRWGLDGWLYVGNGDSGGAIKSLKTGEEVSIGGRDLRLRPDDGRLETQSGQTQFGRECDDFGNWFGGNNSNPMWHYVLDEHYLRRNPHFAPPGVTKPVSVQPGAAPVFPASRTLTRFNDFDRANRFTSACSAIVFRDVSRYERELTRDGVDPASLPVDTFVCEPVHNLVHRENMRAEGLSFVSERPGAEQQSEFLASTDNWCRPTMVRTGPDGALWISDMYRLVIEHPEWIPAEWQRKLELRAGTDKGRIYRVWLPGSPRRQVPRLDKLDTPQLVAALDSPNGTVRDLVQQLLVWRGDSQAVKPLQELAQHARWPQTKLHALYLLAGFDALSDELLADGIEHGYSDLRRHALRLAESRLNDSPQLGAAVVSLVQSATAEPATSARVTQQLAYSLGEWRDPRAAEALGRLLLVHRDDPYIVAAVMSSLQRDNLPGVFAAVTSTDESQTLSPAVMAQLLSVAVAVDDRASLNQVVASLLRPAANDNPARRLEVISELINMLARRQRKWTEILDAPLQEALRELLVTARELAVNSEASESDRLRALRLLGRDAAQQSADSEVLASLLTPQTPPAIQAVAVESLSGLAGDRVPPLLLTGWPGHSPALRAQVLDVLLSRREWTIALFDALENQKLPAAAVDARRRQQLLQHPDTALRDRATKLLAAGNSTTRQQVLDQFSSALQLAGDSARGKRFFEKQCSKCHRLEDVGFSVGADLAALTDRSPQALLVAILDPNRAVEDKFTDYLAVTNDGRQYSGMILSETGNSLTLAALDGKQAVILRNELDLFQSTGKSFMPEGIERDAAPQDLADVMAYVRGIRLPPKQFPGNEPGPAEVRDDGSIRLLAMQARVYGPTLVYEQQYLNLGWWQNVDDRASWDLDVPKAGKYRVVLDYACHNDSAGNRFLLAVAGQTLGGVVPGTGAWDNYRTITAGTIELPAGPCELTFRSDGPIRSALIDLRGVRLQPEK